MNDRRSLFTRLSVRCVLPFSWFVFPPHFYLSAYFFYSRHRQRYSILYDFPIHSVHNVLIVCFYACPSLLSLQRYFFSSIFSLTCIRWINDFLWFECLYASEDLSSFHLFYTKCSELNRGATHLTDLIFFDSLFSQRIQLKYISQGEISAKINKYFHFKSLLAIAIKNSAPHTSLHWVNVN